MEKRIDFDGYRVFTDEQTAKCGLLNSENELVVLCVMDEITPSSFLDIPSIDIASNISTNLM